jgi:Sec-independent protein translocase protein TatA
LECQNVLLLFGGKKLPELSKSVGESMKNLREGFSEANGAKEDIKKQASQIKQDLSVQPRRVVTVDDENA